jgi:hypothetical protein
MADLNVGLEVAVVVLDGAADGTTLASATS